MIGFWTFTFLQVTIKKSVNIRKSIDVVNTTPTAIGIVLLLPASEKAVAMVEVVVSGISSSSEREKYFTISYQEAQNGQIASHDA